VDGLVSLTLLLESYSFACILFLTTLASASARHHNNCYNILCYALKMHISVPTRMSSMYNSGAGTGPGRVRGNANLQDCLASPSRRSIPSPHECNAHLTSRILHAPTTLLSDMRNLYFSCFRNSFREQVPGHNSAIRALETLPIKRGVRSEVHSSDRNPACPR
jgi:hypothetical protein